MDININEKRQESLVAHQNNDVSWDFRLFDCGVEIDTSGMTKVFSVYDMFGNLIFQNTYFGASAANLQNLRTTRYRYTFTVEDFTYFFGDLNILPI